jgi:23S rRNA (guanosine2251-2'-O)-methyltransferase
MADDEGSKPRPKRVKPDRPRPAGGQAGRPTRSAGGQDRPSGGGSRPGAHSGAGPRPGGGPRFRGPGKATFHGPGLGSGQPFQPRIPRGPDERPGDRPPSGGRPPYGNDRPGRSGFGFQAGPGPADRPDADRPPQRSFDRPRPGYGERPRPAGPRPGGPGRGSGPRPDFRQVDRPPARPNQGPDPAEGPGQGNRPGGPYRDRPPDARPYGSRPPGPRSYGPRPPEARPAEPRSYGPRPPDRNRPAGPYRDRPPAARSYGPPGRPGFDRPRPPAFARPGLEPAEAGLVDPGDEVVAGRRPVEEAFVARREARRLLVVPQRRGALEKLVLHATSLRIPIVEIEGGSLTALTGFDGHQGLALVVAPRRYANVADILARAAERGEPPFVLVLDSLEDPQNVGTLLRSAEAAGAHGVLFPTHRQAPISPAAIKASAGAVEHLLLAPVDDLAAALADLHVAGLRVIGAEAEAALTVREADLRGPIALVVGSEGQGLGPAVRRRCDLTVRIPMRGVIGSLNASVAGSILLFEATTQRAAADPAPGRKPRAPRPTPLAAEPAPEPELAEPEAEPAGLEVELPGEPVVVNAPAAPGAEPQGEPLSSNAPASAEANADSPASTAAATATKLSKPLGPKASHKSGTKAIVKSQAKAAAKPTAKSGTKSAANSPTKAAKSAARSAGKSPANATKATKSGASSAGKAATKATKATMSGAESTAKSATKARKGPRSEAKPAEPDGELLP